METKVTVFTNKNQEPHRKITFHPSIRVYTLQYIIYREQQHLDVRSIVYGWVRRQQPPFYECGAPINLKLCLRTTVSGHLCSLALILVIF